MQAIKLAIVSLLQVIDLIRSLFLLHNFSSFLVCLCIHQQELVSNISFHYFFNIAIYSIDNKIQMIYNICSCIQCYYFFVWFFVYLDFIWTKIFYIDQVVKKLVRAIFYSSLFCVIHFYIDTKIHICFLTSVLCKSGINC